ncbi:MAG: methyltransferase domain-containing protein, partial [Caldilineae bacterium]
MPLPDKLLRTGFFLLYNHLAFTYDAVAWLVSLGAWARWRRTVMPYLRPGPTLELAFGTGGLFADLCEAGRRPVGIDLSPFMARLAARRLRRRRLPLALARARAQALPFPTRRFANVVATFPTPYIFEPATLSEVHRVLADGGRL